eukprot:2701299-Rhodomonas_salina.1
MLRPLLDRGVVDAQHHLVRVDFRSKVAVIEMPRTPNHRAAAVHSMHKTHRRKTWQQVGVLCTTTYPSPIPPVQRECTSSDRIGYVAGRFPRTEVLERQHN